MPAGPGWPGPTCARGSLSGCPWRVEAGAERVLGRLTGPSGKDQAAGLRAVENSRTTFGRLLQLGPSSSGSVVRRPEPHPSGTTALVPRALSRVRPGGRVGGTEVGLEWWPSSVRKVEERDERGHKVAELSDSSATCVPAVEHFFCADLASACGQRFQVPIDRPARVVPRTPSENFGCSVEPVRACQ